MRFKYNLIKKVVFPISIFLIHTCFAQNPITFETSGGKQSEGYKDCILWYKKLAEINDKVRLFSLDTTDAGFPIHVLLFSSHKKFDPALWHKQNKVIILVNNGIHPGEPDGIDASMMLLRDLCSGKIKAPDNVVLAVIPVYNIGGSLNRNSFSRVNQNGPESYGFRGNSQNLDLNRDFIKCDSKEAKAFTKIFHWLNPDIFIDNHVSDGADYQHTMTMLTTQHNKLGGATGKFLHDVFEPALYKGMEEKKWFMCPYVNFEEGNVEEGWSAFYDAPRYSCGYAALFQTIAFLPETHMLKPFADRVKSTYAFMQTVLEQSSAYAKDILESRKLSQQQVAAQQQFALSWKTDSVNYEWINFKGYTADSTVSKVTGMKRLFYDHSRPFETKVKFYNTFTGINVVTKPKAYIIPQGWHAVVELLKMNNVAIDRLKKDTSITVEAYHIDGYKSYPKAYEKHHRNYDISMSSSKQEIKFLKGDYIIFTGKPTDRYVVETLEPLGDDSFFSWNFFDAILQQKEGYSDYRWEDVAAKYLDEHPEVRKLLEDKKQSDKIFAMSAESQLRYVYTHSPYYEPEHMRYPVFRLVN